MILFLGFVIVYELVCAAECRATKSERRGLVIYEIDYEYVIDKKSVV